MDYKVEKIPQYKEGDMIILTKFKPEWGFTDAEYNPQLNIPYKVACYIPNHPIHFSGKDITAPVVMLARDLIASYTIFGGWWIPCEIITHAKSMDELTKLIKDKVKEVKGA